jgi:predicted RNase H-related nuclease YkuK (DUF458 family)
METFPIITIKGNEIHKINQFVQQKDYSIQIGTQKLYYCKEQLIFISRKALRHYNSSTSPFEIKIEEIKNTSKLTITELTSSYLLLY